MEICITDVVEHDGDMDCQHYYRDDGQQCPNDADYEVHHLEQKTLYLCENHQNGPTDINESKTVELVEAAQ
jgi:hypothetical protein